MDVHRSRVLAVGLSTLVGAATLATASPAAASEAYPTAEWADPTGSLICGIKQLDIENERSWKYIAHCDQPKVMSTRAHRKACRWNDWTGPMVGPMGGRWQCSHEPFAQPRPDTVEWNDGLWWRGEVGSKVVKGRYGYTKGSRYYAMPVGTEIELGNITCTQQASSVSCYDTKVKKGFTAHADGRTTWRGVKGRIRTWGDIQY